MKFVSQMTYQKGFTLVEIMVVISIISILAGVATYASIGSSQKSRDAKRQADLTLLQNAVELYKTKYGRYPDQCATAGASANGWSGQLGTDFACSDGTNQYIIGHVDTTDFDNDGDTTERFSFAPEFIPVLPFEKKLNTTNSGYIYRTNSDGTVYKIKAHRTVESEVVTYTHRFKPCDIRVASLPAGGLVSTIKDREVVGWCARFRFPNEGNSEMSPATPCRSEPNNINFTGSYGVWGGFKPKRPLADTCVAPAAVNCVSTVVYDTTTVICR
jgi:prepilin-type N-terminal cleavage/methylation domain-containing protein